MEEKDKSLTPHEVKEIAEKANDWVSTTEGSTSIETALRNVNEMTTRLETDRLVDIQTLRKPLNL